MEQPKTYFIFRPIVYKPDDLICLGQLITDPRKPFQRLAAPLPLEGVLMPRSAPAVEWSATNTKTGESSVGVFTHVFNMITAEASAGSSNKETATWDAAVLETRFFEISEDSDYVEQTARIPTIDKWLRQWRHQGKTLYMITGLKIAKRPGKVTIDNSKLSSVGANLSAVVDTHGLVEVSGHGHTSRSSDTTFNSTPETEYIFAYRLRKLKVMWRTMELMDDLEGGELYSKPSNSADLSVDLDIKHSNSDFEIVGVTLEQCDFGASLPAKDRKLDALDENDDRPCLVIPVGLGTHEVRISS